MYNKLVRPFHGPFRVIASDTNLAEVRPVDCPKAAILRVSKCRVRQCPPEIPDTFWPGKALPVLPGTADTAESSIGDSV